AHGQQAVILDGTRLANPRAAFRLIPSSAPNARASTKRRGGYFARFASNSSAGKLMPRPLTWLYSVPHGMLRLVDDLNAAARSKPRIHPASLFLQLRISPEHRSIETCRQEGDE